MHDAASSDAAEPLPDASSRSGPTPDPRRWQALAVLSLVQLMLILDQTVVNVALPSVGADLGFSETGLAWVVNGYAITFGGLLLFGGRLADRVGRRTVFLVGLLLFAAASAAAGMAGSIGFLIGARLVQGVGAALVSPAALSIIALLFADPTERGKALAVWGGLSGIGGTVGVIASGVLTDFASWRWIFLINLPIAVVALVLAPRLIDESRAPGRTALDPLGALLGTGGISLLVFALLNQAGHGADADWTDVRTILELTGGLALLLAFTVRQRFAAQPLMPHGFLAVRSRWLAALLGAMTAAVLAAIFFMLSLYMGAVLHYSPLRTGLCYLPLAVAMLLSVWVANPLLQRFGPRVVGTAGFLLAGTGLLWLSTIGTADRYVSDLLPGTVLFALGAGPVFVSITMAGIAQVSERDAGIASGLLNAAQQVGSALGLAALVLAALNRADSRALAGEGLSQAAVDGYRFGLYLAALIMFAAAIVAGMLLSLVGHASDAGDDRVTENARQSPK
ncbi:MFS transporter [Streptomyces buecherae]|uniref:MFS transporter n=1 Tax=Streptomyces buecherae TaxID=2763006 RepID=UPI001C278360|nr:MFS transporter [Streptomyces buecherae]